jgi:peptidyl-prolyl cis-trans isomerase B (cyclophilin B)
MRPRSAEKQAPNRTRSTRTDRRRCCTIALLTLLALPLSSLAAADGQEAAQTPGTETVTPKGPERVSMETSLGTFVIQLDRKLAPISTENFLQYVKDGAYDGTIFHRVISNFMIQGGGYDKSYTRRKGRAAIQNEADNGLKNKRGTVAMARTQDPNSATNQFFINVKDNGSLDHRGKNARGWGYAVFGEVVEGMEVVDEIKMVKTGACNRTLATDCPQTPVEIVKATVVE